MAGPQLRVDLRDLGQLFGRELAFERIDRLHQVLCVAPALDRVVGKAAGVFEGLGRLAVGSGASGTGASGTC